MTQSTTLHVALRLNICQLRIEEATRHPVCRYETGCRGDVSVRHRRTSIERQAHIVLRQGRGSSRRADKIIQLGELELAAEAVGFGKAVEERCHPPREALRPPHAP